MKLMFPHRRLGRYHFMVATINWLRRTRADLWDRVRLSIGRRRALLRQFSVIGQGSHLNVVIVVVDSLRYDALSCNGYFRQTTPFLDTFDCRLKAISASFWTYPSVPSILTGLYPHNHGAILSGEVKNMARPETHLRMRDDVLTLPEILRFFGYRVFFAAAIHPGRWYNHSPAATPRLYSPETAADEILGDLGRWIDGGRSRRFFAYVHLADLHQPVRPPATFRHFFEVIKDLPDIDTWDFYTDAKRRADPKAFTEYKHHRRALYDNSLRYVDSAIEAFHLRLTQSGLADSTLLIVTADHGEQFWEHADSHAQYFHLERGISGFGHADIPYREVIEVPLIFRGPVPPRQGDSMASTTDIVPTVLDLCGISHSCRFDGNNVFRATGQRVLLSEASGRGHEKKSLTIGRYRLLYSKEDGVEWLFDLERDPQEQRPITDKAVTSVFVRRLLAMQERDVKRRALETARKASRKPRRPQGRR